ncbi:Protein of unknown function [Gryllus bimaculatus]|nr:Protein of unknown function [Gryllus bimaculatus]
MRGSPAGTPGPCGTGAGTFSAVPAASEPFRLVPCRQLTDRPDAFPGRKWHFSLQGETRARRHVKPRPQELHARLGRELPLTQFKFPLQIQRVVYTR